MTVFPGHCQYCMTDLSLTENCCNQRTFRCVECYVSFMSKDERDSHLMTHIDNEFIQICLICGKKFKTIGGHTNHCIEVHGIAVECRRTCYKCDSCEKFFMSKSRLEHHQKKHSDVKDFRCRICGKEYKYKGKLTLHMKTHGIHPI